MNHLLFDRSTGNISPKAFAHIHTSRQIAAIQPAPRLLFNGGEDILGDNESTESSRDSSGEAKVWAHQSGVNALAIDRFEGNM